MGEDVDRLGDGSRRRVGERVLGAESLERIPVQRTGEDSLCHTGRDEERDTASDSPFGDDLVEEEHQVGTDEQLQDDEGFGSPASELRYERVGGHEVSEYLGESLYEDHHQDQDLHHRLIAGFVLLVAQIKFDDLRTDEQLHDDGRGDDRSNT